MTEGTDVAVVWTLPNRTRCVIATRANMGWTVRVERDGRLLRESHTADLQMAFDLSTNWKTREWLSDID